MNKRVLIISMNALSSTMNNGKTIETIFKSYPKELLSHIYFSLEKEDISFCKKSFRIHLYDAFDNTLRIKKNKYGMKIHMDNNDPYVFSPDKYLNITKRKFNKLKQNWETKIPINTLYKNTKSYLLIEGIWFQKRWYLKRLKEFLNEEKPEVIFYQSNMYSFLHIVVRKIADEYNIPIIIQCTDDYTKAHIENSHINNMLTKYYLYNFKKLMEKTNTLLAIGDQMAEEYSSKYFKGKSFTFSNYVERNNEDLDYTIKKNRNILYAGNLGLNRWRTITKLGKVLDVYNQDINHQFKCNLELYSNDKLSTEMIEAFKGIKSISFGGFLSSKELNEKITVSDYLLHCESFDNDNKRVTRLSISTKVGEYICSNRCILAMGPEDVASINYLKVNNLGKVITTENQNEILLGIQELLENQQQCEIYIDNAKKERKKRFNEEYTDKLIYQMIENAVDKN